MNPILINMNLPKKERIHISSNDSKITNSRTDEKLNSIKKVFSKNIKPLKEIEKYIKNNLILRYNILPNEYESIKINNFILAKYCHQLATFKENLIYNFKEEFLKRYYYKNESLKKIPLFLDFYKSYLKFFCSPTLSELKLNELLEDMIEKKAKLFYNENFKEEDVHHKEESKINNIVFFTTKIRKELSGHKNFNDLSKSIIIKKSLTNISSNNSLNSIRKIINELEESKEINNKINKKENKIIKKENIKIKRKEENNKNKINITEKIKNESLIIKNNNKEKFKEISTIKNNNKIKIFINKKLDETNTIAKSELIKKKNIKNSFTDNNKNTIKYNLKANSNIINKIRSKIKPELNNGCLFNISLTKNNYEKKEIKNINKIFKGRNIISNLNEKKEKNYNIYYTVQNNNTFNIKQLDENTIKKKETKINQNKTTKKLKINKSRNINNYINRNITENKTSVKNKDLSLKEKLTNKIININNKNIFLTESKQIKNKTKNINNKEKLIVNINNKYSLCNTSISKRKNNKKIIKNNNSESKVKVEKKTNKTLRNYIYIQQK